MKALYENAKARYSIQYFKFVFSVLSREENAMGQFLKEQGSLDKTAAGKMMTAVGKAQCYTSQQRYVVYERYIKQDLLFGTFLLFPGDKSRLQLDVEPHNSAAIHWRI